MKISVIIPTYQEAETIGSLLRYLFRYGGDSVTEIIVVDGGSSDNTVSEAAKAGATVFVSPKKGRAAQMNYGAAFALGDIFYFIHADTLPPESFAADIQQATGKGYELGRYRTKFQSNKPILQINAFFTRFDLFVCYGGDQTFFITRTLFQWVGGFDESMRIMEDYDMVNRARLKGRYKIIQKDALVSARKYDTNSWWTVQRANFLIVQMFRKGASQDAMINRYRELLDYR